MSWTGLLGAVALELAQRGWRALTSPRKPTELTEPERQAHAEAARHGAASGAARDYSSKATERAAHASLEAKLNARLPKK